MRFTSFFALVAAPLLVLAQNSTSANPFNVPKGGLDSDAGSSLSLTWTPTTSGTVSLLLRQGASSDLQTVSTIASGIQNSGSYTWSIPSSIVRGSDYAIEIVAADGESNYTPYFVIDSSVTVASTTSGSTTGTASSTSSGSSSSTSGSSSSTSSGSMTTTTGSSSSASGASFQTTTSNSKGSAPRATAAAGMMGLVALGALAL